MSLDHSAFFFLFFFLKMTANAEQSFNIYIGPYEKRNKKIILITPKLHMTVFALTHLPNPGTSKNGFGQTT